MSAPKLKRRDAIDLAELAGAVAMTAQEMLRTANAMHTHGGARSPVDSVLSSRAKALHGLAVDAYEWSKEMKAMARR